MKNLYRTFKDNIGKCCAAYQFSELAIRTLENEHSAELEKNALKKLAEKYQLTLADYSAKEFALQNSQLVIIAIDACFEEYLKDVNETIKKLGETHYKEKQKEVSWLTHIINIVYPERIPDDLKNDYFICEYYRLVRNECAHGGEKQTSIKTAYSKINPKKCKLYAKYKKLEAPNMLEKIAFDDAILFARTSLELAKSICNVIEYDIDKLLEMVIMENKLTLTRYKNNRERCKKSILNYIKLNYRIKAEANDMCAKKIDGYIDRIIQQ